MKSLDEYHSRQEGTVWKQTRVYYIPGMFPDKVTIEPVTYIGSQTHRVRNGENSPRINGKLSLRSNRFNNYTSVGVSTPGIAYGDYYDYGWHVETYAPVILPVSPNYYLNSVYPDFADNDALIRFFSKLGEVKLQMATFYAERQKTIDTVANKLERVFLAYRDVKRGKPNRAARRLGLKTHKTRSKQAAGQWLELQYGWRPLLGDIHTAMKFQDAPLPTTVYGIGKTSFTKKIRVNELFGIDGTYTGSTVVKIGCDVTVSNPALAFGDRCGLINPLTVAWELTPFSFVIDWALPIGNFLDYLTASAGLSFLNAYRSSVENGEVKASTYDGRARSTRAEYYGTIRSTSRQAPYTINLPNLTFKNPLSVEHLANAIALGRQIR